MDVYGYSRETGKYVGVTQADESPEEPGVFLLPAFTTTIAPPAEVAGSERVFDGEAWSYAPLPLTIAPYDMGKTIAQRLNVEGA